MQQHIAIVYSLPTKRLLSTKYGATDTDTHEIAKMVERALGARGYDYSVHPISENEIDKIADINADCVFNLIEWCGADIAKANEAFKYLRSLKIPVTGASEELFCLTGDKGRLKAELMRQNIATPSAVVLKTGDERIEPDFPYPAIVKPTLEHCSIGLTEEAIVSNEEELRRVAKRQIQEFEQDVLVEEFIKGRELLVYLVEEAGGVRILPIEEVTFEQDKEFKFQTYQTKWIEDHPDYNSTDVVLAKLTKEEKRIVESECRRAYELLGFRGYGRFDIRLKEGKPYILETNANPSVYDATYEIEDIEEEVIWGIKFPDYIKLIVDAAFRSFQNNQII